MDNLLDKFDRDRNPQDKFWQRLRDDYKSDIEKNKIYEGYLKTQNDNHGWSSSYYLLTSSIMYKYKPTTGSIPRSPISCSDLSWKRVEPYTEENTRSHRYGFRLCRGLTFHDLYTEGSRDLENWLSALSKVAVMTEMEDDYVLIRELGKGSYATVYLARSRGQEKEYAIKSISKEVLLKSSRNSEVVVNEVEILRKLKHHRLVSLHKIFESPTHIHLILDYIPGGELFTRILKRGSYSEDRAAKFIKNMLETLEYMHGLNIVHRDLKPENILMKSKDDDTEFQIADFGLASEVSANMSLRCGSPGYVAPEMLFKKGYGTKVDIFSVGIILYVM
jgi:tRNA A-37 threonylcarbamoyl transferase component Bud32